MGLYFEEFRSLGILGTLGKSGLTRDTKTTRTMRSFVGVSHISHSFTFKQQGILLPSPLGEGVGVRPLLRYSP